ncbi:VOC family protein [Nonomuraea sp. NPDC005983]|uniref:VOC family protein n=1 Tax=Nonomuraea sp. NPDC005983 TaxID=3155595 RepID=UPI0033B8D08D
MTQNNGIDRPSVWPCLSFRDAGAAIDTAAECAQPSGGSSIYVVTDDPDAVFARATAAGAKVVREIRDEDYVNRTVTVRGPEGNLWSFGTYPGS